MPHLCIADFFRTVESPDHDYASFMLVTMGSRVSERCQELFAENRYTDYLMLHGLGVEMAEALAELWHKRIRQELGYAEQDGPTLTGLFRQRVRGVPAPPRTDHRRHHLSPPDGEVLRRLEVASASSAHSPAWRHSVPLGRDNSTW